MNLPLFALRMCGDCGGTGRSACLIFMKEVMEILESEMQSKENTCSAGIIVNRLEEMITLMQLPHRLLEIPSVMKEIEVVIERGMQEKLSV